MLNLGTAASHAPLMKQKVAGSKPMPYASQKQRAYFNVNRKKLEKQGVNVDEWNQASKGKSLPVRAPCANTHRRQARSRCRRPRPGRSRPV